MNSNSIEDLKEKAFNVPLKMQLRDYRELLIIIISRGAKRSNQMVKALHDIGLKFSKGQVEYYLKKSPITEKEISKIQKGIKTIGGNE